MTPSKGRIVFYRVSAEFLAKHFFSGSGVPSVVDVGEEVVLVVTGVQENRVRGHLLLDSPTAMWIDWVEFGPGPGQWSWPPRIL